MTILNAFAVKDIKAESFGAVNFYKNTSDAMRAFGAAANDTESSFYKYAEDFVLYHLGKFDDDTGLFTPFVTPKSVMTASDASTKHREYYASIAIDKAAV